MKVNKINTLSISKAKTNKEMKKFSTIKEIVEVNLHKNEENSVRSIK